MKTDVAIELNGVWKVFGNNAAAVLKALQAGMPKDEVLRRFNAVVGIADASLRVRRGEIFCIIGMSGSGKSTLLRHVNRLIEPTAGAITVLGSDVCALNAVELRQLRAEKVGMVFQHVALLPHRSVRDNAAYSLEIRHEPKARRWAVAEEVLALVGLSGYEDRYPEQLSGGMQQRVGLARALASNPDILLMDEPFSALDPLIRRELQDQFIELSRRLGKTTLFVTHDLEEAIRVGSRIGIMKDGRIIQIGTAAQIVTQPVDEFVRAFVQHVPKWRFVTAGLIMEPLPSDTQIISARVIEVAHDVTLDKLMDYVAESVEHIRVVGDNKEPIGIVTRTRLWNALREYRP
jgi:glycine betaine/proline transport system ATP-binding protein